MENPERDWFKNRVPTQVWEIWEKLSEMYAKYGLKEKISNHNETRGDTTMLISVITQSPSNALIRSVFSNDQTFAITFHIHYKDNDKLFMLGFSITTALNDPRYRIDLGAQTSGLVDTTEDTFWNVADGFLSHFISSSGFNA